MSKKDVVFLNCQGCTHCTHKYCMVYKRPVDLKFNKCKNHSLLKPNAQPFKADARLEQIMEAEERAAKKHNEIWQAEEDEIIRKLG